MQKKKNYAHSSPFPEGMLQRSPLDLRQRAGSIMTSLAFYSANILYPDAVHFACLKIVVEFFVYTVKLISRRVIIIKIHFCFAVTVYAPAHAKLSKLLHFIHFSN